MRPTKRPVGTPPTRKGCWPFSLEQFDRTPSLSKSEIRGLAMWNSHWLLANSHSSAKAEHFLHRLLVPLDAVLNSFGRDSRTLRAARAYILNTMHRTHTSFWAWGEKEWLECIGARYRDFPQFESHNSKDIRNHVLACAYLLSDVPITRYVTDFQQQMFARNIFGTAVLENALAVIMTEVKRIGFGESVGEHMPVLLSEAFLIGRSPYLKDFTLLIMQQLKDKIRLKSVLKRTCIPLSQALYNLEILLPPLDFENPFLPKCYAGTCQVGVEDTVSDEWLKWIERWYAASTSSSRKTKRIILAKAGRWCEKTQNITSPTQWTRDTCITYVAAVNEMKIGDWKHPKSKVGASRMGKPLKPSSKANLITTLQAFFADCQDWGWLPAIFSPRRYLAVPAVIKKLLVTNPRVIADDVWAKLMHAGISLTADDILISNSPGLAESQTAPVPFYPWEMIHAIVIIWLFAGLRAGEIKRLSTGCIRWEEHETPEGTGTQEENVTCLLTVPVNKTSSEFVKPVDPMVGHAIQVWEKMRPTGPTQWDIRSGQDVQYLFRWRGRPIGKYYLNKTLIPLLCQKAGVPEKDARGAITSHRARATIVTQLFNTSEGFSLYHASKWLGHKSLSSTQHYVAISPTKLAESYSKAGYNERNRRMIDVWVDQDAIRSGKVAAGSPLLLYDLGHGLCSYDFFAKCEHRMACAKCDFYQPKESSYVQMLEAKGNLLRLKQSIILTKDEVEAVDDGIAALEKLTNYLQNVATPQGPTPRELHG